MNYKLYIGLDVQNGKEWEKSEAINIIISICKTYGINALSLTESVGVYTYDDGKTVQENTLVLLLVNTEAKVLMLAEDLKKALKQECIMIEKIKSDFDFV